METRTNQALANITDVGIFERLATAVLRLVPDYEGLAHTGINADGKTRKSPVDGLRFLGEAGCRLILVHHTTTAADGLRNKWLLDPNKVSRRSSTKGPLPPPGDVIKSLEIFREERERAPDLAATLVLTTNQEPDEDLIRDVTELARTKNVTVDFWTRSRISGLLDTNPRGQFIRRKLLDIDAELLSSELLAELSAASIKAFDTGDDPATRVSRNLDTRLRQGLGTITFLVSASGSGKTVACHKALQSYQRAGGVALIIPHNVIEQEPTLEQAVMVTLHQLHPALATVQSVFGPVAV